MNKEKKYNGKCISAEIIELYYADKLSKEETRLFEEHILSCPVCSDIFDAYNPEQKEEIKKNLDEIKSEINAYKKNAGTNWKTAVYSSAAAILIFALSFLFQEGNNSEGNKLAEKYLTHYPDVTLHTRGAQTNDNLKKAMLAYDTKNYKEAVELFDAILKNEENETARFYNAVSNMELENVQKAIDLLKPLAQNKDSEFYAEANWYLALAYLRIDNSDKARKHLLQLLDNTEYKKKAGELITELSKKP